MGSVNDWVPGVNSLLSGDVGGAVKDSIGPGKDLTFARDRVKDLTTKPKAPEYPKPDYKKSPGFSFKMPEMPSLADQQAQIEAQMAEQERLAGLASMNELYNAKFEAANKATAAVNQQIADEASHAKLRGLDFRSPTEEEKLQRINKVFSTYWSETQETQLNDLVGQWGAGKNIWDSGIQRIAGEDSASIVSGGEKAGEKVKTTKPVEVDDEEKLGGVASMLG